jgi:hypothetical protein
MSTRRAFITLLGGAGGRSRRAQTCRKEQVVPRVR